MELKEALIIQLILCFGTLLDEIGIFIRFIWGTDNACFLSTKLLFYGTSIILTGLVSYLFGLLIMIKFLCFITPIIGMIYIVEAGNKR